MNLVSQNSKTLFYAAYSLFDENNKPEIKIIQQKPR